MKQILLSTIAALVLVGCGNPEADRALLKVVEKGNNPEADRTLLDAVEKGNIEAVKQHIAAGANVNAKTRNAWTPLHGAAEGGHGEIVELLIAAGADLEAKNKLGWTPLHHAALRGHKEVAEVLIAKGVDVNAKEDNFAETPLDFAEDYPEIADLLRKHGGKTGEELKAEGESETLTNNVLRVSCGFRGSTYMPFTSWDISAEKPIGYDPDLIKLVAKEIGLNVKFVDAQSLFKRSLESNNQFDARLAVLYEDIADVSLNAITINNRRNKLVDFSMSYFTDGLALLAKKESKILTLDDLKEKKILTLPNTTGHDWCLKELSQSIVVAKSNLDLTDLLGLLQRGEVDAYVADRANLLSITSRDRRLKLIPIELTKDYLGIAVKKGNTELLEKINAALIKFKENGELKKLEAKWF